MKDDITINKSMLKGMLLDVEHSINPRPIITMLDMQKHREELVRLAESLKIRLEAALGEVE